MGDVAASSPASNEPVIAPLPTPISVEPRTAPAVAPAGEAAEQARQSEEAKLAANARREEPKKGTEAKAEEKTKPLTTREALRKAAEKVNAEPASPLKVEPKAAEPGPKEAPVADKGKAADIKADTTKVVEPVKDAPVRAADGKFVSADPAKAADAAKVAEPAKVPALPSHTAEAPPARMSAKAKEEWASLPEESRAEVSRMEKEFTAGFAKYKSAAERDAGLAEFHDMAAKSQKELRNVVAEYVSMENLLRQDTVKGIELICKNAGLSPRDVAAKILGQAPDAAASAADQRVIALEKELASLKTGLGSIQAERQKQHTDATTQSVTEFAAAHPRFDELAEDIAFFLKTRHPGDLAKAYEAADRLNPAPASSKPEPVPAPAASTAAPVIAKPTLVPASSSDAGTKSIAGAPSAGSDPVRKQPSSSIKEALIKARARAG